MRRLSLIGGTLAIALVGLVAACGSDPVSRVPFSPVEPAVAGLQIIGPASIAPGQSAQFTAQMRLSDGTVKSLSALNVRWRTNSGPATGPTASTPELPVDPSGAATAGPDRGDVLITAELVNNPAVRGTKEVIILPDGTYRVVGSVREADAPMDPIAGALVQVSGTSLSTTTDARGEYRLYGVPPAAEIRVSANGYLPAAQSVQLAAHATQTFNLALSGSRITLNGPFTLAIDVVGSCSGDSPLAADLQHRTYDATVTTTGSLVDVRLTESSRFRVNNNGRGNGFRGRADAAGVTFTLDYFYYYYYSRFYPSLAERLPNNTYLVVSGTATTSWTNGGVSGEFGDSGRIANYDSAFPSFDTKFLGACWGPRLTLTPR